MPNNESSDNLKDSLVLHRNHKENIKGDKTFIDNVGFNNVFGVTQDKTDDSKNVATTKFVHSLFDELTKQLEDIELLINEGPTERARFEKRVRDYQASQNVEIAPDALQVDELKYFITEDEFKSVTDSIPDEELETTDVSTLQFTLNPGIKKNVEEREKIKEQIISDLESSGNIVDIKSENVFEEKEFISERDIINYLYRKTLDELNEEIWSEHEWPKYAGIKLDYSQRDPIKEYIETKLSENYVLTERCEDVDESLQCILYENIDRFMNKRSLQQLREINDETFPEYAWDIKWGLIYNEEKRAEALQKMKDGLEYQGIHISVDGSDVDETERWVTEEFIESYMESNALHVLLEKDWNKENLWYILDDKYGLIINPEARARERSFIVMYIKKAGMFVEDDPSMVEVGYKFVTNKQIDDYLNSKTYEELYKTNYEELVWETQDGTGDIDILRQEKREQLEQWFNSQNIYISIDGSDVLTTDQWISADEIDRYLDKSFTVLAHMNEEIWSDWPWFLRKGRKTAA